MRDDYNRRNKWIILVMGMMIIILLGVIAYTYWAKPAYTGFIVEKQVEAYNAGITASQAAFLQGIVTQIQQTGYVQIPLNENQTLYLAPFNPVQ